MSDVLMKLPIVMSSVERRIRPRESSRCCADTRLQTECCLFQQRGHLTITFCNDNLKRLTLKVY
ncbi:hypothetical protein OUZ56_031616 [Daphnia magna]|uniref:Uncharacterized protein n=1 Tax=Daphnia magna TaxID=35525 RepID=A0ABQ9ZUR1_9CRUS|nr:hypothetical protein OUZ56_031616 [Daphnia magna]